MQLHTTSTEHKHNFTNTRGPKFSMKYYTYIWNQFTAVLFTNPIIKVTLSPLLSLEADTVDLGLCADALTTGEKKTLFCF